MDLLGGQRGALQRIVSQRGQTEKMMGGGGGLPACRDEAAGEEKGSKTLECVDGIDHRGGNRREKRRAEMEK